MLEALVAQLAELVQTAIPYQQGYPCGPGVGARPDFHSFMYHRLAASLATRSSVR